MNDDHPTEPTEPTDSSLALVRWIGWAQRRAGEDWIRSRELTHEQGFVLGYLVHNPGAIQRDIARVSGARIVSSAEAIAASKPAISSLPAGVA